MLFSMLNLTESAVNPLVDQAVFPLLLFDILTVKVDVKGKGRVPVLIKVFVGRDSFDGTN